MLHSLHSITNMQELLCMNPVGAKSKGSRNMHPNNQLDTEKWGDYYTLFAAMLHSLHSVINEK